MDVVTETTESEHASRSRWNVLRWQAGVGSFGVPQAAAPIAFGLVALPLTGSAESGAAMVFAMTLAQVIGAVPMARFGRRFNSVQYLRALIAVRTLALGAVTVLAAVAAPFWWLLGMVVLAGFVNGAAYGYQRLLLNYLVEPSGMPRALGIAATLNEVTFALSPVIASLLGAVSPVWALAAISVLGAGPLFLMPRIPEARAAASPGPRHAREPIPAMAFLWLFCAAAGAGAVAAVEVGAVSFALAFDLEPAWAFLFASVLCAGSITGGVWVSIRNRMLTGWQVALALTVSTAASTTILLSDQIGLTFAGAFALGFCLPILGTFFSLILDQLAPAERRAEVFALLRTSSSIGVIIVSGVLALAGLQAALVTSVALIATASILVILQVSLASARR